MNNCVLLIGIVMVCGCLASGFTKKTEPFNNACFVAVLIGFGYLLSRIH